MACGSCGKKSSKPNLPNVEKTSGTWKLTLPDKKVLFFDTRVAAQSANLRHYRGLGTVERS